MGNDHPVIVYAIVSDLPENAKHIKKLRRFIENNNNHFAESPVKFNSNISIVMFWHGSQEGFDHNNLQIKLRKRLLRFVRAMPFYKLYIIDHHPTADSTALTYEWRDGEEPHGYTK